jgi:hypothetical protein
MANDPFRIPAGPDDDTSREKRITQLLETRGKPEAFGR